MGAWRRARPERPGSAARSPQPSLAALLTPAPLAAAPPTLPICSDVLLEKHYKGIINRSAVETFWEEVSKRSKRDVSARLVLAPCLYP
jgi:hypothetical protein